MSTTSSIMLKEKDGTVKGVYCHWNGYIEENGLLLFKYFNSEEKVRAIIEKGGISVLRPDLGTEKNDFNNPSRDISIFYHRDRGDELEIHEAKDEKEYYQHYGQIYNYLFKNGNWYVKPPLGVRFVSLERKLKKLKLI